MLAVAALLTAMYALINAFAAWTVVRRRPLVAVLFMLTAACLMVAAAALVTAIPYTRVILGAGLILASVSAYANAVVVVGRLNLPAHLIRAGLALALFLFAHAALLRA